MFFNHPGRLTKPEHVVLQATLPCDQPCDRGCSRFQIRMLNLSATPWKPSLQGLPNPRMRAVPFVCASKFLQIIPSGGAAGG